MEKDSATYLIAINAAILGGIEVMKVYESGDFETEIKEDNSPVTLADKNASDAIIEELKKISLPILCEEINSPTYQERKAWTKLWIVDPLDGTKEFIKRTTNFCVNIGLVENQKPVFGVIYLPVQKTIYFGGKNIGVFKIINCSMPIKNISQAIQLETKPTLNTKIITGGKCYLDEKTKTILEKQKINYTEEQYVGTPSAIKFCEIVEGISDVYPRLYPCMEWDTAAGHAIINAIGKEIYNLDTNLPLTYNKESLYNPYFILK